MEVYKMRTNVVLDDELVIKAFRYSKETTKKGLIHEALEELIAVRQRLDIRDLKGKIVSGRKLLNPLSGFVKSVLIGLKILFFDWK